MLHHKRLERFDRLLGTSIGSLVEAAAEVKVFSQSGWLDAATEQEMLEAVKSTRAQARSEGAAHPAPHAPRS